MNLINRAYHLYERKKYTFIVFQKYTIVSHFTLSANPQFTLASHFLSKNVLYGTESGPRVFVKTQILENWSPFIIFIYSESLTEELEVFQS